MINVRRYNLNIDKQNVYNDDMQLIGVSVCTRGEYVKFEDYAVLELKLHLAKQAYDRLHQVHLAAMEMWRQETEGQ